MNILTVIQSALTALNQDAELFLLEKSRAENEELEHTGAVVVVHPNWTTRNSLNMGMELLKVRTYNIDFKTLDEWDNSDSDSVDYGQSTVDKVEEMETLADSIFTYITAHNNLFPTIRKKLDWKATQPIIRQGNGTMSGVRVQLEVTFTGERVCP